MILIARLTGATTALETIQNKMHWASHGETAAETVYKRVIQNSKNKNTINSV
jgi:hypothetical protein